MTRLAHRGRRVACAAALLVACSGPPASRPDGGAGDGGSDGGVIDGAGCDGDCAAPVCGDTILGAGEACDDGNASDWDGCNHDCTLGAFAYIKASNTDAGDFFGWNVAMSADGATLVVGACDEDSAATVVDGDQRDNLAEDAGAVYVFARSGATWQQQAYLKASNTDAGDRFGCPVALSADGAVIAVGAWFESSGVAGGGDPADNSASRAGAVYVFVRSGARWNQQAYLKASNTAAGSEFGRSVALSGDGSILAVGALGEASGARGIGGNQLDTSAPLSGAVYMFTRTATTWTQEAYIKASNTDPFDFFGASLALSGDGATLVVGAPSEDSAATGIDGDQSDNSAGPRDSFVLGAGAAYVFTRTGGAWRQQAYVKASNTNTNDSFGAGAAISADGSTIVVGATDEDSAARGIDGDQTDNRAENTGAAYAFVRSGNTWRQDAYIKAFRPISFDQFGFALALSADGSLLEIGSPFDPGRGVGVNGDPGGPLSGFVGSAGAVYVYGRNAGRWRERAYVKASNTGAGDRFGSSLSMSGDGSSLVIGALGEASPATGINGDQIDGAPGAGAVYVYR